MASNQLLNNCLTELVKIFIKINFKEKTNYFNEKKKKRLIFIKNLNRFFEYLFIGWFDLKNFFFFFFAIKIKWFFFFFHKWMNLIGSWKGY
jgi:phage-related protein